MAENNQPADGSAGEAPAQASSADPKWLTLARSKIGEHEEPGPKDNNPFILECFLHTTYHAIDDQVPWCAAFVCWALDTAGVKSPRTAAALGFAQFGNASELKPGAIVVFRFKDGSHHAAIVDRVIDQNTVACVGGNQRDSVRVSNFGRDHILAVRWP